MNSLFLLQILGIALPPYIFTCYPPTVLYIFLLRTLRLPLPLLGSIPQATMNKNNSNKTSINIIHWNCRGARNKLPEIQGIANNVQVLCLQETLITSSCQFKVNGFKQVNFYSISANIRGLCTLIRDDYNYTNLDCSAFSHPSAEILGTRIDSLDEPVYIFNIYRHPNRNTPSSFYNNLFAFLNAKICTLRR